jgi:glycosyltransferase involved in cell wall biosynthesis
LKRRLKVPVVATLQGDDIFLESLPPAFRTRSMELIRENCREVDGYIATCQYYADFMSGYLGLPRERMQVVYPGIKTASPAGTQPAPNAVPTVGYFARIAPEKGLHNLADAFILLRKLAGSRTYRLRIAGWLGKHNERYFTEIRQKLSAAGLGGDVEHVDCPAHADKVKFLQSIDVLSVPTTYREPKGLYILEALSHGVPVVQPRHGSFPELLDRTGGGLLVEPGDPAELAAGLRRLLDDVAMRTEMGAAGRAVVHEHFTADVMARNTLAVLQDVIRPSAMVP